MSLNVRVRRWHCFSALVSILLVFTSNESSASSTVSRPTKRFSFNVEWKQVTKLCQSKQLLTVNGQFPGPTITVEEGDNIEIKVTNRVESNTTIHWHGVRQYRTAWSDGPAYVTQCPIMGGQSYTYRFGVPDQRGTLLWHAHFAWQRASVHGAFVIRPRLPYPFPSKIHAEVPIIFAEWWKDDVAVVEAEMLKYGSGPKVSNAYTINGLPGPTFRCSSKDTFILNVEKGETYLLRIINAAMNGELFFAVARHTLTVVEVDAAYTKPFSTPAIMVAPGQTTNVLLTADQSPDSSGMFPLAITPYLTSVFPSNNFTALGFIKYNKHNVSHDMTNKPNSPSLDVPNLPRMSDTPFATQFTEKTRSLASLQYPCRVPKSYDKRVVVVTSLNVQDCPSNMTCKDGFPGKQFLASMNNQSFVRPTTTSILESHYKNLPLTPRASNFPEDPPNKYDFTGIDPTNFTATNMSPEFGSKLLIVPYGTDLEIVFQSTSLLSIDNHPIHIHGHNFFVVGLGFGNFDREVDPAGYNLGDPPERNTVAVPAGGWAALRLHADNPGVWFVHCHLEVHMSWGLAMALVVQDGPDPTQELLAPPADLPPC